MEGKVVDRVVDRAVDSCGSSSCSSCAANNNEDQGVISRLTVPLLIACGLATLLAILTSLLDPVPMLPLLPTALAFIASVIGLVIIFPNVKAAVLKKSIDINILLIVAVVGAWLLGDYLEAATVLLFFSIGEWLEGFAISRNRSSIEKLMDLTPQLVRVKELRAASEVREACGACGVDKTCEVGDARDAYEVRELAPEAVALGSVVLIRPGDRIPLDGTVLEGTATVDESPITGESIPALKQPGDTLYAGSLSVDGMLEFTTTSTVKDSTLARIVALVKESQEKRTPYERFINRFAKYYTPLVIVVALVVAIVPTLISLLTALDLGGITVWGYRALTLLVIACPCALVIATPVSVVSGLTRAARMGVLVKGGAFLELSAKVKAIAFDKTGTLTYGKPEVTEVVILQQAGEKGAETNPMAYPVIKGPTLGPSPLKANPAKNPISADQFRGTYTSDFNSRESILLLAAALEQHSTHPLARAVIAAIGDAGAIPRATGVTELAGRGITGVVEGRSIAIGSPSFARSHVDIDEATRARIAEIEETAATALVVLVDDIPVALIGIRDRIRPESPTLLRQLKAVYEMHTVMLTGDNIATSHAIARETGVDQVYAALLPSDKMEHISQLKSRYGTVVMVGDGINDAPALALADVGIAMGGASSDTAIQVADVTLMANSIDVLPQFFKLSRKVVNTIYTNVAFALSVKATVMVLAIAGIAQMWMAIFADVGVLIIVLLYSMRLGLSRNR